MKKNPAERVLLYLLNTKSRITRLNGISFEAAGHPTLEAQTVKNLVRRGFVNRTPTETRQGTFYRYTLTNTGRSAARAL